MSKTKSLMNAVVAGVAAFLLLTATPVWAKDAAEVKIGNFTFGPQELKAAVTMLFGKWWLDVKGRHNWPSLASKRFYRDGGRLEPRDLI
jgi:hypothetical protein